MGRTHVLRLRKRRLRRQEIDGTALKTFERLRRVQLVQRLRLAAGLNFTIVPIAALSNLLFLNERLPERMLGFGLILGASLVLAALLRTKLGWRRSAWIAAAYIVCVGAAQLYLMSQSPTSLDTLLFPVGVLLVGTALLFPWGAGVQAALSLIAVAGFTAVQYVYAPPKTAEDAYNLGLSLVLMAGLSIVTAAVLQSHRFASCLHRSRTRALSIQGRRLVHIGRELRETLDPERLLPRLVQHARRMVRAELVGICTRDGEDGPLRLNAAEGDSAVAQVLGIRLPPELSDQLCATLASRDLVEYPGGPLDADFDEFMSSFGYTRFLGLAVGKRDRLHGFLGWYRRDDEPFTATERLAAEGIADQAYTALAASQLYARALEASRLKSEFVSTVSHEFRTPLSVIIGYAEMSRDPDVHPNEKARGLEGIETSARELLLLVEHTLDISRIESGHSQIDLDAVGLPAFFHDLSELCAGLPRASGVELEWPGEVPDRRLQTDRRRLGIIVRNLVSNALKFTDDGRVSISLAIDESHLRIRVADTGIGIKPEDQPVIFEIFRQADGSETRRHEGTGLGLYLVKQFAKQLGADVSVESAIGRGSVFEIRVPGILAIGASGRASASGRRAARRRSSADDRVLSPPH